MDDGLDDTRLTSANKHQAAVDEAHIEAAAADAAFAETERLHQDAAAGVSEDTSSAETQRLQEDAAAGAPEESAAYDWASQASGDAPAFEPVEYPNFAPPAHRVPFAQGASPPAPFVQGTARRSRSEARNARAAVGGPRSLPQRPSLHARARGGQVAAMEAAEPPYVPRPGEANYQVAAVLHPIQNKYRVVDRFTQDAQRTYLQGRGRGVPEWAKKPFGAKRTDPNAAHHLRDHFAALTLPLSTYCLLGTGTHAEDQALMFVLSSLEGPPARKFHDFYMAAAARDPAIDRGFSMLRAMQQLLVRYQPADTKGLMKTRLENLEWLQEGVLATQEAFNDAFTDARDVALMTADLEGLAPYEELSLLAKFGLIVDKAPPWAKAMYQAHPRWTMDEAFAAWSTERQGSLVITNSKKVHMLAKARMTTLADNLRQDLLEAGSDQHHEMKVDDDAMEAAEAFQAMQVGNLESMRHLFALREERQRTCH